MRSFEGPFDVRVPKNVLVKLLLALPLVFLRLAFCLANSGPNVLSGFAEFSYSHPDQELVMETANRVKARDAKLRA
jgi:hypothetical protein